MVHAQRDRGGVLRPLDVTAVERARRQLGGAGRPVGAELLHSVGAAQMDRRAGRTGEHSRDLRNPRRQLARRLAFESRVGELGRAAAGEKGSLDPPLQRIDARKRPPHRGGRDPRGVAHKRERRAGPGFEEARVNRRAAGERQRAGPEMLSTYGTQFQQAATPGGGPFRDPRRLNLGMPG